MFTDVRIDGESVDLAEDVKISLNLVNPHLSYDSIPDSQATIPNLPFSVNNQRIFEYAEIPQAGNDLHAYDCELLYNGALTYQGKAYVKSANPLSGYQLEVGDDLNRFFGQYQNTLLTELDLGTIPLPAVLPVVINAAGAPAVCFPTILNADYYGTNGAEIAYDGFVNKYVNGSGYTAETPRVPHLFINYLLTRIAAATGVTIGGNYLSHPTWNKLILTNWRALDGENTVTINRHVPAWTVPMFLMELRKIPNLELSFDSAEKYLNIDFWEDKLNMPPAVDWTDKATIGVDKYPEFNRRLHLATELDGADSLMKDKPDIMGDYITPSEAVLGNIAIGLAKVSMRLSTFLTDSVSGLPIAKQTGVTKQFNQLSVTTAPRLLFWHGLQGGIPKALPELNGISLYIKGDKGIGETSWNRIEDMRLGMFYLKKSFVLTETDLALLDFSRMIHYKGLNYLIAHISGELPLSKECSCLLVKI
ncbi:hypothetical protein [Dyadobacter diqingensis]|uniref:hypothetical protein n=1 Tax=Dyadobacter diqingensis TaxID=2938121 RepID=UPI0020C4C5D7|nr:hypothetical protein [Dyadobacter diqingensis]